MSYDEKKLISFKEEILKDIEKKVEILIKEALENKEKYLKKVEEEISIEEQKKLKEKEIEIKSKYEYETTKKDLEAKKEILVYRNKLIKDIIKNCEKNLKNFAKTMEYENYIIRKVEKNIKETEKKEVVIKISEQDLKFENQIKALYERIEIQLDKKNVLGGFKLIDIKNKIEIDETFKTALETIIKDFYKTNKLNLKNF